MKFTYSGKLFIRLFYTNSMIITVLRIIKKLLRTKIEISIKKVIFNLLSIATANLIFENVILRHREFL